MWMLTVEVETPGIIRSAPGESMYFPLVACLVNDAAHFRNTCPIYARKDLVFLLILIASWEKSHVSLSIRAYIPRFVKDKMFPLTNVMEPIRDK
ncbi:MULTISPECIES: hypothetical protein [Kosakonia]|uniref:hypothetical protein n=1 Tax=Kosakonia TaxID=1330547 RepID=UPI00034EE7C4|nr:hypothetical protein [Kosakonia sacchari]AGN87545.1 hypothetical protein H650_21195 [Enterobacter sp. R4-368]PDO87741.1 hypothetical protein BK797_05990 [Kosakonia sacchari]QHM96006.1 hypothetical protein FGE25_17815 [Kosakonia sacchari]RCX00339.1 hypothetical protein DFO56_106306 [Kosakonia sp. AG348]